MSDLTKNPNDGLLKELQCPCCVEYMLPPIYFCENGHNVCRKCKPITPRCPDCKQPYLRARNLTLENICKQVEYPCIYRKSGCQEAFPLGLIQEHQSDCPFSPYNCPILLPGRKRCLWKGPLGKMKDHLYAEHKNCIWETNEFIKKQMIVTTSGLYNSVIFMFGEIFYVQFRGESGNFYAFVKYVGPQIKAQMYKSVIRIRSEERDEFVAGSFKTLCYKEDSEEVIREGKCWKIHYDVASKFLDRERNASIRINIKKRKPKYDQ